jgi:hypothetical protein
VLRTTTRALAIAGALTLLLAGCGDDGDDEEGSDQTTEAEDGTTEPDSAEAPDPDDETTTTTGGDETTTTGGDEDDTTTTAAEGPSAEEAQAVVDGIDITAEDLSTYGGGWTPEEDDDSAEDEDSDGFDDCFGETGEIDTLAEGDSDGFTSLEVQAFAGSSTIYFASVEDATAAMDTASTEEFRSCVEDFAGDGADSARIDSYPQGTRFGEQWVVLGGVVEGTADDGTPLSISVDINLLRTGPLVTLLAYYDLSGGGEATASVVDGLMTTLDQRQADAVG